MGTMGKPVLNYFIQTLVIQTCLILMACLSENGGENAELIVPALVPSCDPSLNI